MKKIVAVAVAAMLAFSPVKAEAVGFYDTLSAELSKVKNWPCFVIMSSLSLGTISVSGSVGGWIGKIITLGSTTGENVGRCVGCGVGTLIWITNVYFYHSLCKEGSALTIGIAEYDLALRKRRIENEEA